MKKQIITFLMIVFLAFPISALAMENMDHSEGSMILLGAEEVGGVKASVHLRDIETEMTKHGMKMTHHIMVRFLEMANSVTIEKGQVAVKVKDPSGKVSKAHKLMGMDGHFGVDLILGQKGVYNFIIATKFPDGKKRTFHFQVEL